MTRWSYKKVVDPDERGLIELGADGWELVSVSDERDTVYAVAWLKKPMSETHAEVVKMITQEQMPEPSEKETDGGSET